MSKIHEVKTLQGLSRERWERAKPILFNTEMVQGILEERKTATRRVVKPSVMDRFVIDKDGKLLGSVHLDDTECVCYPTVDDAPYGPGDILYVRETWCNINRPGIEPDYYYFADTKYAEDYDPSEWKWRPSIHMPKEAARLFLRVTDVRVEWLQDITIEDIHSEGWPEYFMPTDDELKKMVTEFVSLWDSTIKPADRALYGWDANPWVWVIEFERISRGEA